MASKLDPERPRALDLDAESTTEQPEKILFPNFWNRAASIVLDKAAHIQGLEDVAGHDLRGGKAEETKPDNLICCSLVSSGEPHKCA